MILKGGRIFVIFWAIRHVCVIIHANIGKHRGVSHIQAYYKSYKCLIFTKLDQHVGGMMTAAGENF